MTTHSTSREVDGHGCERALATGPAPAAQGRTFGLGIWWLALGYFVFYAPYAALTKIFSQGLLPGVDRPASPFEMLPATGFATAVVTLLHHHRARLVELPGTPQPLGSDGALADAAHAAGWPRDRSNHLHDDVDVHVHRGVRLVGVAAHAKRRAHSCSSGRLPRSESACDGFPGRLSASVCSPWPQPQPSYRATKRPGVCSLTVGIYVGAYAVRLPCLNALAKTTDRAATCRYFVEEQFVAMAVLIGAPLAIALVGSSGIPLEIRHGVTSFLSTSALWPSLLIGALYALLCWFGTLIYLDRRENTFCIPLNRSSSLLAGLAVSYGIAFWFGERTPSAMELFGTALIAVAILVLSPLHHLRLWLGFFERLMPRSLPGHSESVLATGHVEPLQAQSDVPVVPVGVGHVGEPLSVGAPDR